MQYTFEKVTELPATLSANSIYIVQRDPANDTHVDLFITGLDGVSKQVGNEALIRSFALEEINDALGGGFMFQIVETIASRDALISELTANSLVLVNDASADATVNSGAALYSYNIATSAFGKLTEFEGLDATVEFTALVGGPSSSAALIDGAVAASHTHANAATLDKIAEDTLTGTPTFDGNPILTVGAQDW